MPALNFQDRFAPAVEAGRKRTTIRRPRPDIRRGKTLYLYTGQRTKACRKLKEATCTDVLPLHIDESGVFFVSGQGLTQHELARLAHSDTDGLLDVGAFVDFFKEHYGLPFDGVLISWV